MQISLYTFFKKGIPDYIQKQSREINCWVACNICTVVIFFITLSLPAQNFIYSLQVSNNSNSVCITKYNPVMEKLDTLTKLDSSIFDNTCRGCCADPFNSRYFFTMNSGEIFMYSTFSNEIKAVARGSCQVNDFFYDSYLDGLVMYDMGKISFKSLSDSIVSHDTTIYNLGENCFILGQSIAYDHINQKILIQYAKANEFGDCGDPHLVIIDILSGNIQLEISETLNDYKFISMPFYSESLNLFMGFQDRYLGYLDDSTKSFVKIAEILPSKPGELYNQYALYGSGNKYYYPYIFNTPSVLISDTNKIATINLSDLTVEKLVNFAADYTSSALVANVCLSEPIASLRLTHLSKLLCTKGHKYEWYCNDSLIHLSETNQYTPSHYGRYKVVIHNKNGIVFTTNEITYSEIEKASPFATIVNCYPNPFTNQFSIQNTGGEMYSYTILDMNSSLILEGNLAKETKTLDLGNLNPGLYLLELRNQKSSNKEIVKLIKL